MKRRLFSYFEVLEICREINKENGSKNIKRNVSVIQDIDGNNIDDAEKVMSWCKDERAFYKWTAGVLGDISSHG